MPNTRPLKSGAVRTPLNLPVVFGPVAISYNINAVDTLVLDAPTLAKIFNGTITRWNDPAITALNQSMPAGPITVVHRSDESGTTETFQEYLEAASDGAWGKGTGRSFNGRCRQSGEGNEGTAATVKNTEGAITYNEWSFAQAQNLFTAKILTPAGKDPVGISPDSVGKTIAGARSRSPATTLCSIRRRSTSRPRPARTPSCSRPTNWSARSIPTPRLPRQSGLPAVHARRGSGRSGGRGIHAVASGLPVEGAERYQLDHLITRAALARISMRFWWAGQEPGCSRCRFMIALTQLGATASRAFAVTAIRGAMRTGRVRAAVTIQSAASAGVSAGSPS